VRFSEQGLTPARCLPTYTLVAGVIALHEDINAIHRRLLWLAALRPAEEMQLRPSVDGV
jgi:hypothetical protein